MRKTPPATIPLEYDYQVRMSPSTSTAANYYDNQTSSLFGDPVPPAPEDFLENLDSHLYGSLRRSSIVRDFPKPNSFATAGSDTISPAISRLGSPRNGSARIFSTEPQTRMHLRPEIRVLPGSDSSSDSRISPERDIMERKENSRGPVEVDSENVYHQSYQNYNWDVSSRLTAEFSEGYQESEGKFREQHDPDKLERRIFPSEPFQYTRQMSNDSYSSSEWFKPSNYYQEWTRIPRMRPSSKNVMSIKQNQHFHQESPVATLIHDSNGSSSSEEKRSPDIPKAQDALIHVRPKTSHQKIETEAVANTETSQPVGLPPTAPKRDVSPVIFTNAITTGADYRVSPPRPHKKTSFTIIAEKSPQSSRAQSPPQNVGGRVSPFVGKGFKELPRPSSQPVLSTSRLRLPLIGSAGNINTSDDSSRPSVQFNVSSFPSHVSPLKARTKGILNKKPEQLVGEKTKRHGQKVGSFDALPRITGPAGGSIPRPPARRLNKSSTDLYAAKKTEPQKPYVNPNPTSRQKGLLRVISSADNSPSRIPVRTNLTASMDDLMLKRRPSLSPLRTEEKVGTTSPERRSSSQTEPRSSIVSLTSDRRSSNISSVTTSDFSFRRPSNSSTQATPGRRQSIYQTSLNNAAGAKYSNIKKRTTTRAPRKVAKPTTLSPIIGTPNREGPSSSEDTENILGNAKNNNSNSKIPVREGSSLPSAPNSRIGSRTNSRVNSRATSVANSRSNSPTKDYITPSQSRLTSRSPSRATSRSTSQPPSRQASRPASRSSSFQDFRVQSRSNSRSNSRLGHREISPAKTKSPSPPKSRKTSPTKSRSTSPQKSGRRPQSPSKSPKKSGNEDRGRGKTKSPPRKGSPSKRSDVKRDSPKRSSLRKEPASAKKTSSNIRKPESSVKRTPSTVRKEINLKKEDSNLKRSTSNLKRESSSLTKTSSSSNLKREPSNLTKTNSALKREQSSIKRKEVSSSRTDVAAKPKKESTAKGPSSAKKGPSGVPKKRTDSNVGKKLEKKGSFRNEKKSAAEPTEVAPAGDNEEAEESGDGTGAKLVPLTKQNVVSMTTAAITAQPVQITTAVTNQMPLSKTNSSNQLLENSTPNPTEMLPEDMKEMLPAAILEKSTKTLETIQKTVAEATEEIQKTINENLTDLKTLESDIGKIVEDSGKPTPFEKSDSLQTIIEIPTVSEGNEPNRTTPSNNNHSQSQPPKSPAPPSQPVEAEVSVITAKKAEDKFLTPNVNHNNNNNNNNNNESPSSGSENHSEMGKNRNHHEDMAERVSERAISVLPEVECESENLQSYEEHQDTSGEKPVHATTVDNPKNVRSSEDVIGHFESEEKDDGDNKGSGSQEYLDEEKPTGCCGKSKCCQCCSRFCMPCRRCQCSKCCRKKSEMETAVIATEVDEKPSCWKRMKCCKKSTKRQSSIEERMEKKTMETISEEPEITRPESPKQNKCRLCLNKFFCCKATNKVEAVVTETEAVKKCCFCIPCKKKQPEATAWQEERRESILSAPPPPGARSTRLLEKLMCWKKPKPVSESRRTSMTSKKQSIAPTLPPEDTRPKLHVDLVEFNSKMKGAIPVMPLPLAWFCMICNCLIPGLGTIFSGFFCLCVGIPRFSQYDSAKARLGSLIINCIVGISQLFCVLFCFVGWGWSIWWGTIMLKTARKLRKIRKVERLEMEEEQRQAAAVAAASAAARIVERDVEAAKT